MVDDEGLGVNYNSDDTRSNSVEGPAPSSGGLTPDPWGTTFSDLYPDNSGQKTPTEGDQQDRTDDDYNPFPDHSDEKSPPAEDGFFRGGGCWSTGNLEG